MAPPSGPHSTATASLRAPIAFATLARSSAEHAGSSSARGLVAVGSGDVRRSRPRELGERSAPGGAVAVEERPPRIGGDAQHVGDAQAARVGAALEGGEELEMRHPSVLVERRVGVRDRGDRIGLGQPAGHAGHGGGDAVDGLGVALGQVEPHRSEAASAVERDHDQAAGRVVAQHARDDGQELRGIRGFHDSGGHER